MNRSTVEPVPVTGFIKTARWPGVASLAVTALISTILLIGVGSLVRVTGHGLGCPDWPLCYGRAIPPMITGAWVEFSHRLLGGLVSLQIVGLAVLAWRSHRQEKWIWRPAVVAVGVLVLQVSLGGLHVLNELPRWTGLIHTGVAMLIAGLLAMVVAETQPALRQLRPRISHLRHGSRLPFWTAAAAAATYILILTGSLVTRTGASLACPSFPHCGLSGVPGYLRTLITIQMIHRYAAFAVALAIGLVLWHLLRAARQENGLRRFAALLIGLLLLQFGLGISNVLLALPMWSRILHLATAGTIWAVMVILAMLLYRSEAAPS